MESIHFSLIRPYLSVTEYGRCVRVSKSWKAILSGAVAWSVDLVQLHRGVGCQECLWNRSDTPNCSAFPAETEPYLPAVSAILNTHLKTLQAYIYLRTHSVYSDSLEKTVEIAVAITQGQTSINGFRLPEGVEITPFDLLQSPHVKLVRRASGALIGLRYLGNAQWQERVQSAAFTLSEQVIESVSNGEQAFWDFEAARQYARTGKRKRVLFVTEEDIERGGMRYPVRYCTTSRIDRVKGVHYGNYPVAEVADWSAVKVIHLLHNGRAGSRRDIARLSATLETRSAIEQSLIDQIQAFNRALPPMTLLQMSILAAMGQNSEGYEEDCWNLIAKIPAITAAVINHHAGWAPPESTPPWKGYLRNFCDLLGMPMSSEAREKLNEVIERFGILHFDHGGGNLSTHVATATSSGLADLYTSVSNGIGALSGSRHGGASQDALRFVKTVHDKFGPDSSDEDLKTFLWEMIRNRKPIPGFGHGYLQAEDARAKAIYKWVKKYLSHEPLVRTALRLRRVVPEVLGSKTANPYANIDQISGTILWVAGFPHPEYYPAFFGMWRAVGMGLQILHDRKRANEGKGTQIVRPEEAHRNPY